MKTLVIPTSHKEYILVHIGGRYSYPSESEFDDIREWVKNHNEGWPNNFDQLQQECSLPLRLEIFPPCNPNNEYVFVLESEHEQSAEDIEAWTRVLCPRKEEQFTVFCFSDYFNSIRRMNKILIPFT